MYISFPRPVWIPQVSCHGLNPKYLTSNFAWFGCSFRQSLLHELTGSLFSKTLSSLAFSVGKFQASLLCEISLVGTYISKLHFSSRGTSTPTPVLLARKSCWTEESGGRLQSRPLGAWLRLSDHVTFHFHAQRWKWQLFSKIFKFRRNLGQRLAGVEVILMHYKLEFFSNT